MTGLRSLGVFAAVLVAASAWGQGHVDAVVTQRPIHEGATSIDLGFVVSGDVASLDVAISVTGGADAGPLIAVPNLTLQPDSGGLTRFHTLVPLAGAVSADTLFVISATPRDSNGSQGAETSVTWSMRAAGASIDGSVRVGAGSGTVSVAADVSGPIAFAEATLVGLSGAALREANGNLQAVQSGAFVSARRVRAVPANGTVSWSAPTSADVPVDGVVVVDLLLEDVFGRRVHRSAVEYTTDSLDSLLDLSLAPQAVYLRDGLGSSAVLQLTGSFMIAGAVPISAPAAGLSFRSDDSSVATVDDSGRVVALRNGTTTITASFAGLTRAASVVVDSTSTAVSLSMDPASGSLPRVGIPSRFHAIAGLSSGVPVDVSAPSFGTLWRTGDPTIATVSSDGQVTGLRAGTTDVTAHFEGMTATGTVTIVDAAPEIQIAAPASLRAGDVTTVYATVSDDVGVSRVEWLVNGVPSGIDTTSPFSLSVRAPPQQGAQLAIGAVAIDSAGHRTTATPVSISVTGGCSDDVQGDQRKLEGRPVHPRLCRLSGGSLHGRRRPGRNGDVGATRDPSGSALPRSHGAGAGAAVGSQLDTPGLTAGHFGDRSNAGDRPLRRDQ